MTSIHPTAIVDPKAELAASVKVGPYSIIGPDVKLGDDVVLHSHVVLAGRTTIGARTQIYPFASIGQPPQDLKYRGEPSTLEIGTDTLIREYVTMNAGTEGGGMVTRVGNNCTFLASAHVGHDCIIGDNVILSNTTLLAGHCRVADFVIFGGAAAVHQFVRVGKHAFIGGASAVESDVIPFGLVVGNRAHLMGLNLVGLKRRGFSREQINAMRDAYGQIFSEEGALRDRVAAVGERFAGNAEVTEIVDFIQSDADRPLCLPRK
ncbi:acyl-ACP--UDP-N-acetylglucosamine O-acyltransferase [Parvibaculum sp.]|uniref:acyl-ACP--UDP-N-acetylglucosamine O-acyltransferase n=1 Tax=Parvibaculum sp. TaxID=2024848 RepID=UPI002BA0F053|nr:acyl-ACP--UDP-N-acetylglucosamine O-acyltransferase [Parvibaculum sp.]HUD52141.1 acyl-ACP--UDP-N-acetylglucosamine O-acyltransferase [Parvibaculum sp.]